MRLSFESGEAWPELLHRIANEVRGLHVAVQLLLDSLLLNYRFLQAMHTEKKQQRRKWQRILNYLPIIGLSLFIYILYKIGIDRVWNTLTQLGLSSVLMAGGVFFLNLILRALRWYRLLIGLKIKVHFTEALSYYLSSIFYGSVTWGRVGELYKMRLLKKKNEEGTRALFIASIDRIIDVLFLMVFVMVYFLVVSQFPARAAAMLYIAILIGAFAIALLLFRFVLILLKKYPHNSFLKHFHQFFNHFKSLVKSWVFIELILFTFATWALYALCGLYIANGLGVHLQYIDMAMVLFFSILVGLIPITFQGLGTRDFVFIQAAIYFGFKSETGIAISIAVIIVMFTVSVTVGSIGLLYEIFSINRKGTSFATAGTKTQK